MRFPRFRCSIRSLLIALAVATSLAVAGREVRRWVVVRADCLRQVDNYRTLLGECERSLGEAEAGLADPEEQALLAKLPDDQRAGWTAMVDQLRRSREVHTVAIDRWQHLADHPWEPKPADLYRVD